jgi:hypothetical protein
LQRIWLGTIASLSGAKRGCDNAGVERDAADDERWGSDIDLAVWAFAIVAAVTTLPAATDVNTLRRETKFMISSVTFFA